MTALELLAKGQTHSLEELPTLWKNRAADLRPFAPAAAEAFKQAATELENSLEARDDELLTLGAAAMESGYSPDHLGREIRSGRLRNAGRKGAPRIRRGDLPRKANLHGEEQAAIVTVTSKRQIAQSVVNSERGRHDG